MTIQVNTSQTNLIATELDPYVKALMQCSSLDENQAKLCAYYAILTHKLEGLELCPILVLYGQFGTGKSSIMKAMAQLVYKPLPDPTQLNRWSGLKMSDTNASLRDTLEENTTAFLEEGDSSSIKNEQLIGDRYSRQTAVARLKRESIKGYVQDEVRTFGASVIHKRGGFTDESITSRCIFVQTKYEPNSSHRDAVFSDAERQHFEEMATATDICPLDGDNRADDLWLPLIGIAINAGDGGWAAWAYKQKENTEKRQGGGGDFDPQRAVLLGLIDNTVTDVAGKVDFNEGKVELAKIRDSVEANQGVRMKLTHIKNTLELAGFEVRIRTGVHRVHVTAAKLKKACAEFGVEDEALDAIP